MRCRSDYLDQRYTNITAGQSSLGNMISDHQPDNDADEGYSVPGHDFRNHLGYLNGSRPSLRDQASPQVMPGTARSTGQSLACAPAHSRPVRPNKQALQDAFSDV